jgi:hypothetical protein
MHVLNQSNQARDGSIRSTHQQLGKPNCHIRVRSPNDDSNTNSTDAGIVLFYCHVQASDGCNTWQPHDLNACCLTCYHVPVPGKCCYWKSAKEHGSIEETYSSNAGKTGYRSKAESQLKAFASKQVSSNSKTLVNRGGEVIIVCCSCGTFTLPDLSTRCTICDHAHCGNCQTEEIPLSS